MILVDIYVPSVDKTYNFSLNENVEIHRVIDELVEMIGQKEHTHLVGTQEQLELLSLQEQRALPGTNTLNDCGITPGMSLMLI